MPPAPKDTSIAAATITATIMWSQTSRHLVNSYTITYSYNLKACRHVGGVGNVTDIDGNSSSYMLTDLKPYADYSMLITAEGFYGNSTSGSTTVATKDASKITMHNSLILAITILRVSEVGKNICLLHSLKRAIYILYNFYSEAEICNVEQDQPCP